MNLIQLKKDISYRIQMVLPALHLDAAGQSLPTQDEDWLIETVNDEKNKLSKAPDHSHTQATASTAAGGTPEPFRSFPAELSMLGCVHRFDASQLGARGDLVQAR